MANFLIHNLFRIAVTSLNFVSPSIIADILLHPFDFATVLLQIGYDPEGVKYEAATLVSVIVQYALFTFYIPYLLTSMQGLQFMGMPHPSIFYYVNYIYSKEGFMGCYRGLMPKICERLIMVGVNDKIKKRITKGSPRSSDEGREEWDQEKFLQNLVNSVCSQFFAVLASHPFHVLMVSSFAEFTYDKKSSVLELSRSIYADDGYFGFFTGLTARLLGELLSLTFSLTYTTIINKQLRPQPHVTETPRPPSEERTASHLVNYVTDISRFTAFKPQNSMEIHPLEVEDSATEELEIRPSRASQYSDVVFNFLGNLTQHHSSQGRRIRVTTIRHRRTCPLMAYIPLTSKLFYYIMLRDFLSKKISSPFFFISHRSIVLHTGWDKFPLLYYLEPLVKFVRIHLTPTRRNRLCTNETAIK